MTEDRVYLTVTDLELQLKIRKIRLISNMSSDDIVRVAVEQIEKSKEYRKKLSALKSTLENSGL